MELFASHREGKIDKETVSVAEGLSKSVTKLSSRKRMLESEVKTVPSEHHCFHSAL